MLCVAASLCEITQPYMCYPVVMHGIARNARAQALVTMCGHLSTGSGPMLLIAAWARSMLSLSKLDVGSSLCLDVFSAVLAVSNAEYNNTTTKTNCLSHVWTPYESQLELNNVAVELPCSI